MTRHIVARTSEIPSGGNKVFGVEGRDIVVFHVNGEFFALLNRCPHEGAPLEKAACVARLTSPEPGVYERSRIGEMLRCPWHGWEFDMRNGQSWFDPVQVRVRRFDVTVEPGSALLAEAGGETGTGDVVPPAVPGTSPEEIAAAADPNAVSPTDPSMEGMQPGPYVA